MAAALPFVDDFLTCHNLQSLTALSEHLGRLPRRGTRARSFVARQVAHELPAVGARARAVPQGKSTV
jgi:hypothetical protein